MEDRSSVLTFQSSTMIKATVQEAKGKMIKDSLNGSDPKLQKHV